MESQSLKVGACVNDPLWGIEDTDWATAGVIPNRQRDAALAGLFIRYVPGRTASDILFLPTRVSLRACVDAYFR